MILSSARVSTVPVIAIIIQCCNVLSVRSSHLLDDYSPTTSTVDSDKSKMLPAWVIIVIVLLVLTALCFCIGIGCYRFICGETCYSRRRHNRVPRAIASCSHNINHRAVHSQGTEQNIVCISGEDPIHKEDKQDGQLCSVLYQSGGPPRYEDVIQCKSYEVHVGRLLDNRDHGSTHDTKSPPPSY